MGIPQLNKLLQERCSRAIEKKSLKNLKNKTIAVDISIYLYKFNAVGNIVDGLYQFIHIFKKHDIKLIFVFDGKAPDSKAHVLLQRKKVRQVAKEKCKQLELEIEQASAEDKASLIKRLRINQKQANCLPENAYSIAKQCISLAGCTYYEAHGEADTLCVKLVQEEKAWACLSDDMDMFVYGCTRVLRKLNIFNEEVYLYDYPQILRILKLNVHEFRMLCCTAGTDYTPSNMQIGMNAAIQLLDVSGSIHEIVNKLSEKNVKIITNISKLFDISNIELDTLGIQNVSFIPDYATAYMAFLEENNFIFLNEIKTKYKRT